MKKAGKPSNEELQDAYSKLTAVNYNSCRAIVENLLVELINKEFWRIEIPYLNAAYVTANYDKLYITTIDFDILMVKYAGGYFLLRRHSGKMYLSHYIVEGEHRLIATACAPLFRSQFLTNYPVSNKKELLKLISKV